MQTDRIQGKEELDRRSNHDHQHSTEDPIKHGVALRPSLTVCDQDRAKPHPIGGHQIADPISILTIRLTWNFGY